MDQSEGSERKCLSERKWWLWDSKDGSFNLQCSWKPRDCLDWGEKTPKILCFLEATTSQGSSKTPAASGEDLGLLKRLLVNQGGNQPTKLVALVATAAGTGGTNGWPWRMWLPGLCLRRLPRLGESELRDGFWAVAFYIGSLRNQLCCVFILHACEPRSNVA